MHKLAPIPRPLAPERGDAGGLRRRLYRSAAWRLTLQGRRPDHLRLVIPFSWPEDRAAAEAILHHTFDFFGHRYTLGADPWLAVADAPVAAAALHGFAWLGDLRAVGSKVAQLRARELVETWIAGNRRWSSSAWAPGVLGARVAAWIMAADFLLTGAEPAFPSRFFQSLAVQARHLGRVCGQVRGNADAFAVGKGRLLAALCLGVGKPEPAVKYLSREADRQVLPDGSHVQRCPAVHLAVMRDLLDVRTALQEARRPMPPALAEATDRMVPILRALRSGDGALALFHGGKESDRRFIDAILARSGIKARPVEGGGGFQRLAAGRTVIVLDAGPLPPSGADRLAHVAPLAFEMSVGRDRLVVNCGSFAGDDPSWRRAMRVADAHSTLVVGDANVVEIRDDGRLSRRTVEVTAQRRDFDGSVWVDARHDGYRRRFGLIHHRRLYVHESGDDVRGEDRLDGSGREPFRVRFHLHPDVDAAITDGATAVIMRTPDGSDWRFMAAGGTLSLEESVYLGGSDIPRRSIQIVVTGAPKEDSAQVKWAFQREGGRQ